MSDPCPNCGRHSHARHRRASALLDDPRRASRARLRGGLFAVEMGLRMLGSAASCAADQLARFVKVADITDGGNDAPPHS